MTKAGAIISPDIFAGWIMVNLLVATILPITFPATVISSPFISAVTCASCPIVRVPFVSSFPSNSPFIRRLTGSLKTMVPCIVAFTSRTFSVVSSCFLFLLRLAILRTSFF